MEKKPLILIIDDETAILQTLQQVLEDESYRVKTLADGRQAIGLVGELVPDVVFLDVFMPHCNGLDLLGLIKKEYPTQKVIMISGFGNIQLALDAVKRGAIDFIEKPINLDDVLHKLELVLTTGKSSQIQQDSDGAQYQKHGIIGQSALFLESMLQVHCVSMLKTPLLMYGLHGTGKTLIAEYIHTISQREGAFYVLDGATPAAHFLKMLKKHTCGTLYIKNVDELDLELQRELVLFLNSPEYTTHNEQGSLRLIFGSSRSLFDLATKRLFYATLFHKINVTPIELVALHKRRYDIPLLTTYFLEEANKKYSKNVECTSAAIRFLRNAQWDGNVAELKRFVENLVCVSLHHDIIDLEGVKRLFGERQQQFVEEQSFLHFNSLQEATLHFEYAFLSHALKKGRFNIAQVSDRLKVSEKDLQEKLSQLNIMVR